MPIKYREGYKYQLAEDYTHSTGIRLPSSLITDYVSLGTDGALVIRKGYAWDGPSGPTLDTKAFMRGALVHDALYQLARTFKMGDVFRKAADDLLHAICREDGMGAFRAWYVRCAVRTFGATYAASAEDVILTAP